MTYSLQIDKIVFFDNFMVSFVNFSRSHDYENFPCCFHDKNGCYAMCYVIVLSSSSIKLQKVNKSGKRRMQHSKCFYSNFWSNFSNFPYNLYFG